MLHAYNGGEEGPQLLFRIDTPHAVATERPILSKLRDSRRRPEKRAESVFEVQFEVLKFQLTYRNGCTDLVYWMVSSSPLATGLQTRTSISILPSCVQYGR